MLFVSIFLVSMLSVCAFKRFVLSSLPKNFPKSLKSSLKMIQTIDTGDISLRIEGVSKFGKEFEGSHFSPCSGGVNNIMDYVVTPAGKKYVLRIYNNGLDTPRVEYEHRILNELKKTAKLSFQIPAPVPNIVDGKGYATLSTGAEACLFEFIPGTLPKKTCPRAIGYAAGELVTALAAIPTNIMPCPNTRYNRLFQAHWATNSTNFFEEIAKPAYDSAGPVARKFVDLLAEETREMQKKIEGWDKLGLPEQIIHADLHYDNVLVDGGRVSGLLDFEFTTVDWRVCELAVGLSKYAGEPDALQIFSEYIDGYAETGRLNAMEYPLIPDLIINRVLSNVVYFVGRAMAKEDGVEALTLRAEMYYDRIQWLKKNNQAIVDILATKIKSD